MVVASKTTGGEQETITEHKDPSQKGFETTTDLTGVWRSVLVKNLKLNEAQSARAESTHK